MRNVTDSHGNSTSGRRLDAAIGDLAAPRHGQVARWQLLALGVRKGAIDYRLLNGRLYPTGYDGVYSVGAPLEHPYARAHAAVLACGPGAVLSHASAAMLWGIYRHWEHPLEVTAASRRQHRNLRVHHSNLAEEDKTEQYGVPVTTAARTLYDIVEQLSPKQRSRAIPDLRHAGWLVIDDLIALLDRHPRTRPTRLLRPHVTHPHRNPTRSPLEDKYLALTDRYHLPEPLVNTIVHGYEVDIYYPKHRLAVELDGYDYHKDRAQFEYDRERDAALLAKGIPTIRVTEQRLDEQPAKEAARLLNILADREPAGA